MLMLRLWHANHSQLTMYLIRHSSKSQAIMFLIRHGCKPLAIMYLIRHAVDFSINGLSTENRLRSQRTPTSYKIKVNNCKLIDLVIRIELIRAILMPWFSNLWGIRSSIFACFCIKFWQHVSWESRFRRYAGYKLYQRYMFQFFPI